MTDLLKDVTSAASAVSTVESAVGAVGDVASVATKLAGGMLAGFMPYLLGVLGAAILGLLATVGFDHYVTIPHWKAQAAINLAAVSQANTETDRANQSVKGLQTAIDDANRKLEDMAQQCRADSAYADLAQSAVKAYVAPAGYGASVLNGVNADIFGGAKK